MMLLNSRSNRESEQLYGIEAEAGRPAENSKPYAVVGEVFCGNTLKVDHQCAQARTKGIDILHMPSITLPVLHHTFVAMEGAFVRTKAQRTQDAPDLCLAVFDPVQAFDNHANSLECPRCSTKAALSQLFQDGAVQRFELAYIESGWKTSQTYFA
jgi:hypothetical protein